LNALESQPDERWADLVLKMCEARDPLLTPHAAAAAGRLRDPRFIPILIHRLGVRDGRGAIRDALVRLGDPALSALAESLRDVDLERRVRVHIPRTISRFRSQRAADILVDRLRSEPSGIVRYKVLRGLGRLVVDTDVKIEREILEAEMRRNLVEHLRVLSLVAPLEKEAASDGLGDGSGSLVIGILRDKLRQSLERVFRLLQIAHRREDVESVYQALQSPERRTRADALEFLDALTVAGSAGMAAGNRGLLRLVVDDLPPDERVARAAAFIPPPPLNPDEAIRALLEDEDAALAALAAYHAVETGRAAPRTLVLSTLEAQPSFWNLGAYPIGKLVGLGGGSRAS
jgi:hypothetical protein